MIGINGGPSHPPGRRKSVHGARKTSASASLSLIVRRPNRRVRTVAIEVLEIDSEQRLFVRPHLSPGENFEFIYRSATGVRWDSVQRALTPVSGSLPAHGDWLRRIVDAARVEYWCALVATASTRWVNILPDLRRELEVLVSADAV